jgi:SAM-dependent methyltransferase
VGVERSDSSIELARQFIAAHHLRNVELLHADATATGLPRASFDFVHARLVLVNLPEPRRVLDEMFALVRPGGILASHEVDWGASICEPPSAAWDRLLAAFEACASNRGVDLRIGRKVPQMLRDAGLVDVEVAPIIHAYPCGHSQRNVLCDLLDTVRHRIAAEGLMSEREYAEEVKALKQHLASEGTLIIPNLVVQAWGKKPN